MPGIIFLARAWYFISGLCLVFFPGLCPTLYFWLVPCIIFSVCAWNYFVGMCPELIFRCVPGIILLVCAWICFSVCARHYSSLCASYYTDMCLHHTLFDLFEARLAWFVLDISFWHAPAPFAANFLSRIRSLTNHSFLASYYILGHGPTLFYWLQPYIIFWGFMPNIILLAMAYHFI